MRPFYPLAVLCVAAAPLPALGEDPAPVVIDEIRIGDITVHDVEATIGEPGTKFITLLGMTFLSKLSRVDIRGRELVLVQ